MLRQSNTSYYITNAESLQRRSAKSILPFIIAFLTVFSVLGGTAVTNGAINTVHADGEDDFKKAASDYKADGTPEGFGETVDKYNEKDANKVQDTDDPYTFANIIQRVFTTRYMNYTPKGKGGGENDSEQKWNCNVDDSKKGTPLYHNCDIPNMTTQFLQTFVQSVSPMGFVGATVTNARSDTELGVPNNLPGGKVPTNYATGSAKYTGMEILGYNLHYTSYKGEWDNIGVATSARLLSNFGLMDDIQVGVNAAINGAINGAKLAAKNALDKFKNLDILGGVSAFTGGWFSGSAAGVIQTVLDTSDMNVFNNYGWYRKSYGGTLYNGRELTQEELQERLTNAYIIMLKGKAPDKAKVPDDYTQIKNGPPAPEGAISKCTDPSGKTIGDTSKSPGISEADCKAKKGSWSKDGTQKQQTIDEWKKANESYWSTAQKYGLDCPVTDTSEANRDKTLAAVKACWDANWDKQRGNAAATQQSSDNQDWANKAKDADSVNEWMTKNPKYNFNAPWARFVCVDANGKTMYHGKDGWDYEFVYDEKGKLNPKCLGPLRPPIQNGYFGNGYLPTATKDNPPNQNVQPDTRYSMVDHSSMLSFLFDTNAISNTIANSLLSVTALETRIANTVLDFSFSPIIQKLGLDKTIVDYIKAFRDGVFFPLIALMLAVSGFTVLINAARNRDYMSGLKSALLTIFTTFVGIIALFMPELLIKVVDSGPAEIETAIAGAVFSGSTNDDIICTASQSNTSNSNDLAASFIPAANVRAMECEVWRVMLFNPYVYGQWGTSMNNLQAAGTGSGAMKNTNSKLIGDASVPMGGGATAHNWAFYQAKTLSSGTITTDDPMGQAGTVAGRNYTTSTVNTIPKDLYRLVDLQAGPNNGEGTDSRFYQGWAGKNPASRMIASLLSIVSSGFMMVVIVVYGFAKIEITLLSMILLIFLPFVLLIGVHPTFGRVKLKQYLGTIVMLMCQRIALVALLSVMMLIITNLALASSNLIISTILSVAISTIFLMQRKKLMSMIGADVSRGFGGSMIGNKTPREAFIGALPLSVQNEIQLRQSRMRGMMAGAAAGLMVNGPTGVIAGARRAGMSEEKRGLNAIRRVGKIGVIKDIELGAKAGKEAAFKQRVIKANELKGSTIHKNVLNRINERYYKEKIEAFHRENPDAEPRERPEVEKQFLDLNDQQTLEKLSHVDDLVTRLENLSTERTERLKQVMPKRMPAEQDLEGRRKAAETLTKHNFRYNKREKEIKEEIEKTVDELYSIVTPDVPNTNFKRGSKEHMLRELEMMREELRAGAQTLNPRIILQTSEEQRRELDEEEYYGEAAREEGDE